jgi:hypothetical protein
VMCGKHIIVRLQIRLQSSKQLDQSGSRNAAKFVEGNQTNCINWFLHCIILPPSQEIRRPRFACFFFTKIYSKYIKNVGIKLASLKSMFQYKSNNNNFTQYNKVLVALFIRSKFA